MNKSELEKQFIDTVRQHERMIYKVCSFYVSDELPMDDLYQEVVYYLWRGFAKFKGECNVSTWIYRVTLNTCISGVRKENRQPKSSVSVSTLEEPLHETEQPEMEEKIREMYGLINRLSTIEKAIVLLYLEEKSYQEIADITGLTLPNVAVKLKRAKDKMRKMNEQLKNKNLWN